MTDLSALTHEFVTPAQPWSYAVTIDLDVENSDDADRVGLEIDLSMTVDRGIVGVLLIDRESGKALGADVFVKAGEAKTLRMSTDARSAISLVIRNGDNPSGISSGRCSRPVVIEKKSIDITGRTASLMPEFLREPGRKARHAVAVEFGLQSEREIGRITSQDAMPLPVHLDRVLTGPIGEHVLRQLDEMLALLPTYDQSRLDAQAGYGTREYLASYLRQSSIRVYHLIEMLYEAGIRAGRILDVGAYLGTFAIPLRHLGFEITAFDRYAEFNGGIDGYIDAMKDAGIDVIRSSVDEETSDLAALGTYDVVLSMAVIEHVPHTPRLFLESLRRHVSPGGVLVIDTPNHTRYWNRQAMKAGRSVHQNIEMQYMSGIPFGGHHREYTMDELKWMLQQVGAKNLRTRYFDYNILQFKEIYNDHFDALLSMVVDESLADTNMILAQF